MGKTQVQGRRGEDIALRFLLEHGLTFVAQNIETPFGELDLIMRDGDELVFVEVKYRVGAEEFGGPEAALTKKKLLRVTRSLSAYLGRIHWKGPYRLDFLAIEETEEGPLVKHFKAIST